MRMRIGGVRSIGEAYRRGPRYRRGVADHVHIRIRNADGTAAGRVSRAPDGTIVAEVLDEEARWLVELAAARYGAPVHPRLRPSCSPSINGRSDVPSAKPSTSD